MTSGRSQWGSSYATHGTHYSRTNLPVGGAGISNRCRQAARTKMPTLSWTTLPPLGCCLTVAYLTDIKCNKQNKGCTEQTYLVRVMGIRFLVRRCVSFGSIRLHRRPHKMIHMKIRRRLRTPMGTACWARDEKVRPNGASRLGPARWVGDLLYAQKGVHQTQDACEIPAPPDISRDEQSLGAPMCVHTLPKGAVTPFG